MLDELTSPECCPDPGQSCVGNYLRITICTGGLLIVLSAIFFGVNEKRAVDFEESASAMRQALSDTGTCTPSPSNNAKLVALQGCFAAPAGPPATPADYMEGLGANASLPTIPALPQGLSTLSLTRTTEQFIEVEAPRPPGSKAEFRYAAAWHRGPHRYVNTERAQPPGWPAGWRGLVTTGAVCLLPQPAGAGVWCGNATPAYFSLDTSRGSEGVGDDAAAAVGQEEEALQLLGEVSPVELEEGPPVDTLVGAAAVCRGGGGAGNGSEGVALQTGTCGAPVAAAGGVAGDFRFSWERRVAVQGETFSLMGRQRENADGTFSIVRWVEDCKNCTLLRASRGNVSGEAMLDEAVDELDSAVWVHRIVWGTACCVGALLVSVPLTFAPCGGVDTSGHDYCAGVQPLDIVLSVVRGLALGVSVDLFVASSFWVTVCPEFAAPGLFASLVIFGTVVLFNIRSCRGQPALHAITPVASDRDTMFGRSDRASFGCTASPSGSPKHRTRTCKELESPTHAEGDTVPPHAGMAV